MKNPSNLGGARQVSAALLPLSALAAAFSGFAPGESRRRRIYDLLRDAAVAVRGRRQQTFYSMTDVSRFFSVSTATVQAVYRALEQDGLLVRVRGSCSFVPSLQMQPRTPIRGVLAVPIWLPGFLKLPEWRQFFIALEESIRRRGFVADLIFFRQDEEVQPEFVTRVLSHQPDALLWFLPAKSDKMTIDSIADAGVRIGVVHHLLHPPSFCGRQYQLSWADAARQAAKVLKTRGVQRLLMVCGNEDPTAVSAEMQSGFTSGGMRIAVISSDEAMNLARRPRRRTDEAIMFDYDACYLLMSVMEYRLVPSLLANGWPVLLQSTILFPATMPGALDLITFDWQGLASRIATDLHTGAFSKTRSTVVAEAVFRKQQPLAALRVDSDE